MRSKLKYGYYDEGAVMMFVCCYVVKRYWCNVVYFKKKYEYVVVMMIKWNYGCYDLCLLLLSLNKKKNIGFV